MAVYKQGSSYSSTKNNFNPKNPLPTQKIINGRVTDIILSTDHPKYNEVGNKIGTIFFQPVPISNNKNIPNSLPFAFPLNFHTITYPVVDEIVSLIESPFNLNNSESNKCFYYLSSVNLWNTPNHNAFPFLTPSNSKTFIKAQLNSPTDFSQEEFIEQSNIRSILPQMGDTLLEGRNGQSIRFSNEKGNPITYIRNGQDRTTPPSGFEPISENVKNDLSSIYLTSYQTLPNLSLETEKGVPFVSYSTPPITPSQFSQPQVILNSDRVVIEAETDSVLISAGKSVGLFSNESINIESKDINIHTDNRIRLGSKNAGESVLLGDKTYDVIEFTLNILKILSDTLAPNQIYPEGTPIPDASTQALTSTISQAIETVKEKVLVNIKSTKVKVE